jgi:prephenate dehydrogenase
MFRRLFEASGCSVLISGPGTPLGNEELVEQADVVIVAVPVRITVEVIGTIAPRMRPEQLLSDLTSIKREPVEAMLASPAAVIGCHPIFGPMPTPRGQNVVLCPERPGPFLEWYRGFFESHGIRVTELSPEAHDRSMAFIQGLTHFLNITFARTLLTQRADLEQLLQICSPVYRVFFAMLCRILSGDPELYGQIQVTNRENIPVVRDFLANGELLLRRAEAEDWEGVYRLIGEAAENLGDYRDVAREESDFLIERMREWAETSGEKGK